MASHALKSPPSTLYDRDFAAWTAETARLLRAGRLREVDLDHVAEEIEDAGKSHHREMESRATVLLVHLLKWKLQPRKRSRSWRATIRHQRIELRRLFRQSPSVRGQLPDGLEELYRDAVQTTGDETGLAQRDFPAVCPFRVEQILDHDFLPE